MRAGWQWESSRPGSTSSIRGATSGCMHGSANAGSSSARTPTARSRSRGASRSATGSSPRWATPRSWWKPGSTGGATITARYALDYGRDVYALPGSRRNPAAAGCNALIADGAKPLLDPADVLFAIGRGGTEEGGWAPAPKAQSDPDQRKLLRVIAGDGATIDEIERKCALPAERLGRALRALERSGRLRRHRGLWWPL